MSALPPAGRGRPPPLGILAFAAFALCAASGALLAPAYRPEAAHDSLALLLLGDPAGAVLRSLHAWSAQAALVLALAHAVRHLLAPGRPALAPAAWAWTVLTLPLLGYLMLGGFILRGDPAAQQAARVGAGMLDAIPLAGPFLATLAFGREGLGTVYAHHAATATILVWLAVAAHAHRLLPDGRSLAWILPPVAAASLLLVPGLGAGPGGEALAPWYLAGFQEALRRFPAGAVLALAAGTLAAAAVLPWTAGRTRRALLAALAAAAALYLAASAAAWMRGGGGEGGVGFQGALGLWQADPGIRPAPPQALGLREGCLDCHAGMTGLPPAHNPARIGCAACHRGNRFTRDRERAHAGMTRTPGDLAQAPRTCGTAGCHPAIVARVEGSLMNTMAGVVAVDRWAFGEAATPDQRCRVQDLGGSPADGHLRQLCASCHLGQGKEAPGPVGEDSRGGGCSACHAGYGAEAAAELAARAPGAIPRHHPAVSLRIPEQACTGCHGRSGRIALSFAGWAEVLPGEEPPGARRTLADGRICAQRPADIHHQRGMACVDCHLAAELMGDGRAHAHQEDAVRIACADCHPSRPPDAVAADRLDAETRLIAVLRGFDAPGTRYVRTASGTAYPNVHLDGDGRVRVLKKDGGAAWHPRPPSAACGRNLPGHRQVDCRACHSAWAHQCIGCHTAHRPGDEGWDHLARATVAGAWEESGHAFRTDPPVLGVERHALPGGGAEERIGAFVPGMIMRLEHGGGALFRRLYAPVAPHTTAAAGRSCVSCHADPLALGFGRGRLAYAVADGRGRWSFAPALAPAADGLPADAWTGFLRPPATAAATRSGAGPLGPERQRRMLTVGACLQCHDPAEPRLAPSWADFPGRPGPSCALPTW